MEEIQRTAHSVKDIEDMVTLGVESLTEGTHSIVRDPAKCIGCLRCVKACQRSQHIGALECDADSWRPRPEFGLPLSQTGCIECGQCTVFCPTGAVREQSSLADVQRALGAGKTMVLQIAPSVRVAIGELFDQQAGTELSQGRLVTAARRVGFHYVFDTQWAADLCTLEEAAELGRRLRGEGGPLPMFTSCCPAWVTFLEKHEPSWLPHLSTCRSPALMLGSVVKRHWAPAAGLNPAQVYHVMLSPCTAKKAEINRAGMRGDVDAVLTTREFAQLLAQRFVADSPAKWAAIPADGTFDSPLGSSSGTGALFGCTGGVAEAAVRALLRDVGVADKDAAEAVAACSNNMRGLKGTREFRAALPPKAAARLTASTPGAEAPSSVRVAIVNGVGRVRSVLRKIKEASDSDHRLVDFVEVMACPGGCIGGGGQPPSSDPDVLLKRQRSVYTVEERSTLRTAHDNPEVKALYHKGELGQRGSEVALEMLHTSYADRSDFPAKARLRAVLYGDSLRGSLDEKEDEAAWAALGEADPMLTLSSAADSDASSEGASLHRSRRSRAASAMSGASTSGAEGDAEDSDGGQADEEWEWGSASASSAAGGSGQRRLPVAVTYVSNSGTARDCARELRLSLRRRFRSWAVRGCSLDELGFGGVQRLAVRGGILIVCCSSYGEGELPDNGMLFWRVACMPEVPDGALSGLRFATFGLGSSRYKSSYGLAPRRLDARLGELGGTRMFPMELSDEAGGRRGEDLARFTNAAVAALSSLVGQAPKLVTRPRHFRVLVIAGGGVRGTIPSTVCAAVERKLRRRTGNPKAKIGEYFDLIAGSSAGAILSAVLSCPQDVRASRATIAGGGSSHHAETRPAHRYSGQDCLAISKAMSATTFGPAMQRRVGGGVLGHAFLQDGLLKATRDPLGDVRVSELCTEVLFATYDLDRRLPYFITRHAARNDPMRHDYEVAEAVAASGSAPTYLPPFLLHSVGGLEHALIDGGVVINSPTVEAVAHAESTLRVPPEKIVLLSLGTGSPKHPISYEKAKSWGVLGWLGPLIDILMGSASDKNDLLMRERFARLGAPGSYVKIDSDLTGYDPSVARLDLASAQNNARLNEVGEAIAAEHDAELDCFVDLLLAEEVVEGTGGVSTGEAELIVGQAPPRHASSDTEGSGGGGGGAQSGVSLEPASARRMAEVSAVTAVTAAAAGAATALRADGVAVMKPGGEATTTTSAAPPPRRRTHRHRGSRRQRGKVVMGASELKVFREGTAALRQDVALALAGCRAVCKVKAQESSVLEKLCRRAGVEVNASGSESQEGSQAADAGHPGGAAARVWLPELQACRATSRRATALGNALEALAARLARREAPLLQEATAALEDIEGESRDVLAVEGNMASATMRLLQPMGASADVATAAARERLKMLRGEHLGVVEKLRDALANWRAEFEALMSAGSETDLVAVRARSVSVAGAGGNP